MTSAQPKPFAFVLMPFSKEFRDIYEVGIKQACIDAGAYCERVDEQIFHNSMLERIYNQISKADIIISDMTGRNPNVFYETGYAHALGKRVILLTQDSNDIPFDLKHYPHIVYSGEITTLRNELRRRVQWLIENPDETPKTGLGLDFYINGEKVTEGCTIKIPIDLEKTKLVSHIKMDIHNPTSRVIDASTLDIAIILPRTLEKSDLDWATKTINLPDNLNMHLLPRITRLLPSAWDTQNITLAVSTSINTIASKPIQTSIRVFNDLGPSDTTFKLSFFRRLRQP